jgi:hypothetical protein
MVLGFYLGHFIAVLTFKRISSLQENRLSLKFCNNRTDQTIQNKVFFLLCNIGLVAKPTPVIIIRI